MAKMFYTLEEVCRKLGKTEDEVKAMARSGQVQEFRDRDKLMFKVDQIDLLAGGDDTGEVHLELEETSGGSGLDLQEESAIGLEESREGTGISVFDSDHGAEDSTGITHGGGDTGGVDEEELSLESVGSGSGLLDLTRESDDTSLGAELLEEVYSSDDKIEIPGGAAGLFEASAPEAAEPLGVEVGGAVPMVVEAYDGGGSGLGTGLLVGAIASLVIVGIIVAVGIFGATPQLAVKMSGSSTTLMIWGGSLLAGTIIFGLVGLLIGKATE
jgi:hypothetical protein